MSTKKKAKPFSYYPAVSLANVARAKHAQDYREYLAKHEALLNTTETVDVVNTVGDRQTFTIADFKEKYNPTIDPRPDAVNLFVAVDKLTHSVYRRSDNKAEYVEVDISKKPQATFSTNLESAISQAAENFKAEEEKLIQVETKKPVTETVDPIASLLVKHDLTDDDVHPDLWDTPITSSDVMSTKHQEPKYSRILQARSEYQQLTKKDVIVFDGKQGIHDVGLETTPSDKPDVFFDGRGGIPPSQQIETKAAESYLVGTDAEVLCRRGEVKGMIQCDEFGNPINSPEHVERVLRGANSPVQHIDDAGLYPDGVKSESNVTEVSS